MGKLPTLKDNHRIELGYNDACLLIDVEDRNFCDTVRFVRHNSRWRWGCGPFASVHAIARDIFDYEENPSRDEIDWMGGYVTNLGLLLDKTLRMISKGVDNRLLEIEEAKAKRFQSMISQQTESYAMPSDADKNYLYLMRHSNGLTKIGRSRNPRAREKTLQAEDPRLEMIFHREASASVEIRLHRIFDSVRIRGEWFNLKPHQVDWITTVLGGK